MTMLDWEEGRTYEIVPGTAVRILPTDVPVAIEAALRKNGRSLAAMPGQLTSRDGRRIFAVAVGRQLTYSRSHFPFPGGRA